MRNQRVLALIITPVLSASFGFTIESYGQCELGKLVATDGSQGDRLGRSVALGTSVAIVGAPYVNHIADADVGAAYVYVNSNGNWVEVQKLGASDAAPFDYFGVSVALSGAYAIVGASGHEPGANFRGSAYVFVNIGGTWIEQQKLLASDGAALDRFGSRVGIDGDYAVVGSYGDDDACPSDPGCDSGSVYVFCRDDNGTPAVLTDDTWIEMVPKLVAGDASEGAEFGWSVSISGDSILIGARRDDEAGNESGAAYVFERDDNGTPADPSDDIWTEASPKLTASDVSSGHLFGYAVAIDGDQAVISSELGSSQTVPNSGTAYFFHRVAGAWVESVAVTPHDRTANDYFGSSLAIDGDYAVVGARGDDDAGSESGSAYLFRREDRGTPSDLSDDTWIEEAKLTASDATMNSQFGISVAITDAVALVGAGDADVAGKVSAGAAYAYRVLGAPDCNSNGVNDSCELYSDDCNGTGLPDDCDGIADFDGDGDLDLRDFAGLALCFTGSCSNPPCIPSMYISPCCAVADQDRDGDVDLTDYDVFETGLVGPGGA